MVSKKFEYRVLDAAKENLYLHSLDPELFESRIVTGDETYIHHYEPEAKRQSIQWFPSCAGCAN